MKLIIILQVLLFYFINYKKCYAITINGIGIINTDVKKSYSLLISQFNKYSKKEGLDIDLHIDVFSPTNSSRLAVDYGSTIEFLLKKESTKYDIIFYDSMYYVRYAPYMEDLKKYISDDHISLFPDTIISQSCLYKNELVGLPVFSGYDVLYSNIDLLKKYDRDIPKTWDQLIDTALYISGKEKEQGNTKLMTYNGLFPSHEVALCSVMEFIHSFREKKESPYPKYTSQEAIDALHKIKQIMNDLSLEEAFQKSEGTTVTKLFTGAALFAKFWLDPSGIPNYQTSILPGNKEGISGSIYGGTNVGINKWITNEHKEAASKVIKYITSVEGQKKITIKAGEITGINSLYDDEDICNIYDCELMKNIQPIFRPGNLTNNYDEYSSQFRNYFYEFLYGEKDASEVLQSIEDIVKKYTISLDPSKTIEGFIIFIVTIFIIIIMAISFLFLFTKKHNEYFDFISIHNWLIILLGFITILSVNFTQYGDVTKLKCHFKIILNSFGYTFVNIPILYRLIINFPGDVKLFKWIKYHKYTFIVIFILYDVICNALLIISSFEIQIQSITDGKNYEICKIDNIMSMILIIFVVVEKILILISISFLLFLEWNIIRTNRDIKLITSTIYINVLLIVILITLQNMKFNNYRIRFLIYTIFNLSFVFWYYFFIYALRLILALLNKHEVKDLNIRDLSVPNATNTNTNNSVSSSFSNSGTYINKLLKYHYYLGEDCKRSSTLFQSSTSTDDNLPKK